VCQGLFLAETDRLHPDVCNFISELFYEKRLKPDPENRLQRVNTGGPLDGTDSGSFRSSIPATEASPKKKPRGYRF
jgi:superfamily I DNA and/or RNA helicase